MKYAIIIFMVSLFVAAFIVGKSNNNDGIEPARLITDTIPTPTTVETKETPSQTDTISMGFPIIMNASSDGMILHRVGYATSYNKSTHNPNWVAWHLTREHTEGPYPRKGVPYYADDGSVYGIGKVTPDTYKNKYFVDLECEEPRQQLDDWTKEYNMSHGHMCPAGDNKWDKAAMNQSFLLTNMCPQDERLNGGGWKKLEEKCRTWANQYGGIYIVAGPVFKKPITRTIGKGKIAVPDEFFKVVLCLEGTPKAIGFIYKNDSSSQSMKSCACTVDDVEKRTGFDFFASLPDETEDSIEAIFELNEWDVR